MASGGHTRSGVTWWHIPESLPVEEITRLQDSESYTDEDDVSESEDHGCCNPFPNLEFGSWNFVTPNNDKLENDIPEFLGISGVSPIAEEELSMLTCDDEKCEYTLV